MERISVVFFGTHTFAATVLGGLIDSPLIDIALIVTQPDRPVGRTHTVQQSPVKTLAGQKGLPIAQPETLKNFQLPISNAALGVCAQYGLFIPKHILDAFPRGILNVHTSLLPKYRGASPIQTALIRGEKETGVTIMKMDEGLDTGPLLTQRTVPIEPGDTAPDLDRKLALLGRDALLEAIPLYVAGALTPVPQDEMTASMTHELTRDDGRVDWTKPAKDVYNLYRGLTPWPGIWTTWQGQRLKLLAIRPSGRSLPPASVEARNGSILIGCGAGSIEVVRLQLEGKKPADAPIFLNGYPEFGREKNCVGDSYA